MNVQSFSFFYAVLALACWAGTAAIVVGALVRRFADPDAFAETRAQLGNVAIPLAWVIALVTTACALRTVLVSAHLFVSVVSHSRNRSVASRRSDQGVRHPDFVHQCCDFRVSLVDSVVPTVDGHLILHSSCAVHVEVCERV